MLTLLSEPLVASLVGLVSGGLLVLLVRKSARLVTPADPMLGMAKLAIVNVVVMLAALGLIALFYFTAPGGFLAFGIGLAFGFILTVAFVMLRVSSATGVQGQGGK